MVHGSLFMVHGSWFMVYGSSLWKLPSSLSSSPGRGKQARIIERADSTHALNNPY